MDLPRSTETGAAATTWLPPRERTTVGWRAGSPRFVGMISQGESIAVLIHESGVFKSAGQAYSVRGVQWFAFADEIRKIDQIAASIWKAAD